MRWLFGKKEEDPDAPKPVTAKMGVENEAYFDKVCSQNVQKD